MTKTDDKKEKKVSNKIICDLCQKETPFERLRLIEKRKKGVSITTTFVNNDGNTKPYEEMDIAQVCPDCLSTRKPANWKATDYSKRPINIRLAK